MKRSGSASSLVISRPASRERRSSSPSELPQLPQETWQRVMHFVTLSGHGVSTASAVSKWMRSAYFASVKRLVVLDESSQSIDAARTGTVYLRKIPFRFSSDLLNNFSNVRSLDLSESPPANPYASAAWLANLSDISAPFEHAFLLNVLPNPLNLVRLTLKCTPMRWMPYRVPVPTWIDEAISRFQNLGSLKMMDPEENGRVTGACLSTLSNLSSLSLFSGSESISAHFSNLKNLTRLSVEDHAAGFLREIAPHLTNLTYLSAKIACSDDRSIVSSLVSLRELRVRDWRMRRMQETNLRLGALTNLTALSLSGCEAFDEPIPALSRLVRLSLSGDLAASFFSSLRCEELPALKSLALDSSRSFLASGLTSLTKLDIGEQTTVRVSNLPNLEILSIGYGSHLEDASLTKFSNLSALRLYCATGVWTSDVLPLVGLTRLVAISCPNINSECLTNRLPNLQSYEFA